MVVAMTVTPALAYVLLRGASSRYHEPSIIRPLQHRYDAAVSRITHAPRLAFLISGAAVLAGFAILPLLSWSLLPAFKERDVRITWVGAPGTSLPEMNRIMARASDELRQIPGVLHVAAHAGRAVTGDQVVDVESGQIWVGIDSSANYEATLTAIRETIQGYPGLEGGVDTYIRGKMKPVMAAPGEQVVVRVHGPEPDVLRREADRVVQLLSGIEGLSNLRVEGQVDAPQIELRVNLAAAGRVGLKPGDVRRAAATFFAGLEVGYLFEKQQVVEVVVFGAPELRRSLTNLQELLIDTPNGGHVRLADVADVCIAPAPQVIEREGVSRTIDIRADVVGRDVGFVIRDVQKRLQTMEFPLEYHATMLGHHAERQALYWRTLIAALAALIGAYFLLQACFQSWRLASVFFGALLAALAGCLLAIVLSGGVIYLGSIAGILAVLGLALRHGILLVRRCQHLELKEDEAFGPGLVLLGARERFGPVVRSAAAIAVTVLPVIVVGDIAGLEIVHPMAVVVLGGLVTSAIVNLFVLPALYLRFASPQAHTRSLWSEQYATS
jgi:Cu/Ag efflux pump CusA